MATKKRALGKGFDTLFAENAIEEISDSPALMLPINEIEPDKNQPRDYFDDSSLFELSQSITEHGILQPLLVRPMANGSYKIVAGERRWRAAKMAGLSLVPAVVKSLTDSQAAVLALIENLQREDLNPIEEALGISRLISEFGLTQEQAAERLSKSRPAITNSLRLLKLPQEVLDLLTEKKISQGHARALLSIEDESAMISLANEVYENQLSVREVERSVQDLTKKPPKPRQRSNTDKFFKEAELALSNNTGRKVKITQKAEGGMLSIEFFDKDDLQGLIKSLED